MTVQQEPVRIIQIISLPMSFLSLAWAATVADTLYERINIPNFKHKLLLLVTHIFLLSSRLFAIAFFTVSYKWWIISVLMIHSVIIFTADTIWFCQKGICAADEVSESASLCCIHWLRDDRSKLFQAGFIWDVSSKKQWITGTILFSNVLFVVENIIMILVVYMFSEFSITWYNWCLLVFYSWSDNQSYSLSFLTQRRNSYNRSQCLRSFRHI